MEKPQCGITTLFFLSIFYKEIKAFKKADESSSAYFMSLFSNKTASSFESLF